MLPIPMIPSVALVTSTPSQSTAKCFVSGDTAIWQPACKYMVNGYRSATNLGLGKENVYHHHSSRALEHPLQNTFVDFDQFI